MYISEIFESIQGEGRYIGYPALFIRTSGCTRSCKFCDTKYHKKGIKKTIDDMVKEIRNSNKKIIIWTGGEPLVYYNEIEEIIRHTQLKNHHLETNGDLLGEEMLNTFNYVCCSPKTKLVYDKVVNLKKIYTSLDIKIVSNLNMNKRLLDKTDMIMPLETGNIEKDLDTKKRVWDYCLRNNKIYCPRIQTDVWGYKRRGK